MSDDDKRTYMFEIMGSDRLPGNDYFSNLTVHVVSDTFEHAVETFKGEYPDARMHKVERRNYMGRADVIIDPRVLRTGVVT